jgi:ABC-type amino acid transport substrate-binding protein
MFFTSVERKKNYSQIGLVVKKSVIIVFNASKNGQSTKGFSHLNELANKVVGQVRGTTYSDEFSKNESIIKYEVSNYDEGLKMLSQGRLDAFIGSKELIESKFNHDGHYFTLIENETWLQCSKVSSNMTMKFQDKLKLALDNLKNHDEQKDIIVKIHKKYLTRYHRPN